MAERDTRVADERTAIWKQRILSSSCLYPRNSLPFSPRVVYTYAYIYTYIHVHARPRALPFHFASPSTRRGPSTMRPTATPASVVCEDGSSGPYSGRSTPPPFPQEYLQFFQKIPCSRKKGRIAIFFGTRRRIREIGK